MQCIAHTACQQAIYSKQGCVPVQDECNRVRGKPIYRELSGAGSESEQAGEARSYMLSWHDSWVDDIFGGQLQSTIKCDKCGKLSHCFDPFWDLCVPIPKRKKVSVQVGLYKILHLLLAPPHAK